MPQRNSLSNEPGLRDRPTIKRLFLYDYKYDGRYSATPGDYWRMNDGDVMQGDRRNLWLVETETDGVNVQARIIARKLTLGDLKRYVYKTAMSEGTKVMRAWETS